MRPADGPPGWRGGAHQAVVWAGSVHMFPSVTIR